MSAALWDTSSRDCGHVSSALGNSITRSAYVSGELKFILHVLGDLDGDTRSHGDVADNLLANEVADFHLVLVGLLVLLDVDVDGKTGCLSVTGRSGMIDSSICDRAMGGK